MVPDVENTSRLSSAIVGNVILPGDGSYDETREFSQGVYVNFISDEGENRTKEAYTPEVVS